VTGFVCLVMGTNGYCEEGNAYSGSIKDTVFE
jgi:hypothetical protein